MIVRALGAASLVGRVIDMASPCEIDAAIAIVEKYSQLGWQ